jgi:hypothetical protein
MDPIIVKLLEHGVEGAALAVVLIVARLMAPRLVELLPALFAGHARHEEQVVAALREATRAMAEMVTTLQVVRADVADVRQAYADLREDVGEMADALNLPRPKRPGSRARSKVKEVASHGS